MINSGPDSETTALFYVMIDIVIAISAIVALITISNLLTNMTYGFGREHRHNTVISQNEGVPQQYPNYLSSNSSVEYDGIINGENLINDIMSLDKDTDVEINGSSKYVSKDEREKALSSSETLKIVKMTYNPNLKYQKKIQLDKTGKITKITYETVNER